MPQKNSFQLNLFSQVTFHLWLFHVAPFQLQVQANEDSHLQRFLPNGHFVDHFSTFVSSPYSRTYTQRGSASTALNNSDSRSTLNEILRLPVWNGAPLDSDQRHIDFSQLFELMGEPRGSRGRELSELITRPKPKCNRRIRILNGVTRIRERGSLARFQCSHSFTLIGPTTIVCLRDRWSEPPPICVKSGCRPIRRPVGAEVRQSIGGAVVAFYCLGRTRLQGDPILFCDGVRWNGTEPTCEIDPVFTTTPEPESDESWPESAGTPRPWMFSGDHTAQDANWDNNLQLSTLEAKIERQTTSSPVLLVAHTDSAITDNLQVRHESTVHNVYPMTERPVLLTDKQRPSEQVTEAVALIPVYEEEMKTEKNEEVPAPITTENPIFLTHAMGKSDTPSVITSTYFPFVPLLVTYPEQAPILTSEAPPENPRSHNGTPQSSVVSVTLINIDSTPTPAPIQVTRPRRFKILTKRPRRPQYTRRPPRRPFRRTTTTNKPLKPKLPIFLTFTTSTQPAPPQTFSTSATHFLIPKLKEEDQHSAPTIDYPLAIDKKFLPREQVEPIRPIIFPDMLNNNVYAGGKSVHGGELGHASVIIGIVLVVVGLATFSAGVVLYCWRKNKGIARARPYDMDGRTLSAHDANDDFMWVDQRDSGL